MSVIYKLGRIGALGWLSHLSIWLQLRSRSHSLWVQALHQAVCCQHKACFRSSVSLSLCPSPTCSLCVSLPLPLPPTLSLFLIFFNVYLFLKQRESMNRGGAEREGDRGSEMGPVLTAESLMRGLNSQTMRPWPEPKSDTQPIEPLGCPQTTPF